MKIKVKLEGFSVSAGRTVNLGNYESKRIDLSVSGVFVGRPPKQGKELEEALTDQFAGLDALVLKIAESEMEAAYPVDIRPSKSDADLEKELVSKIGEAYSGGRKNED